MAAPGTFKRTLKRAEDHSHRKLMTVPYRMLRKVKASEVPSSYFLLCPNLSYWLNQQDGDCVTAEQCFNIDTAAVASGSPGGYIVSDANVMSFARRYGLLNGADLGQVNQIMATDGMPTSDGKLFKDGPQAAVDWVNYAEVCAAIFEAKGSVQMAIAAGALERAANDSQRFNFAFNFSRDQNVDHCTGAGAGYGTAQQCLDALNAFYAAQAVKNSTSFSPLSLPASVDSGSPCIVMFSWNRYWIVDTVSVNAICDEMYIRTPSSIVTTNPNPPGPSPHGPTRRSTALALGNRHLIPADVSLTAINGLSGLGLSITAMNQIIDIVKADKGLRE